MVGAASGDRAARRSAGVTSRGRTSAALGSLMMDVAGPSLEPEDREVASHPAIGGVVLFDRNFEDVGQLAALSADLHRIRTPPLLLAVDHEGGRVQRFRDGFTPLPAARRIGSRFGRDPVLARSLARAVGLVAATELRRVGIDLAFAPVIDLAAGNEETIGERAFHSHPGVVTALARSWLEGAARAGLAGVGKHFPGHGTARGDTHLDEVVDDRPLARLRATDLAPFAALAGRLDAVMTSHVRFPAVDGGAAATFSSVWIQRVLRRELGFAGIVFSDDLSMEAARGDRDTAEGRVRAALAAGCDAALVMNDRAALVGVLDGWRAGEFPESRDLGRLRPGGPTAVPEREYHEAAALLGEHQRPEPEPGTPLDEGG